MQKALSKRVIRISLLLTIILIVLQTNSFGAVVQEAGNGGNIASSQLFQGFYNMAIDLTGTLQWIIPVVGLVFIAFYVFKIMTR